MNKFDSGNWSTFDYSEIKGIPEVKIRIDLLLSRLRILSGNSQPQILEAGIGAGDVTCSLLKIFNNVVCLDADINNLDNVLKIVNEDNLTKPKIIHSTIEKAELVPGSFDHIILFGLLEHLEEPKYALKKTSRFLTDSGTIHIVVNLANSIHRLIGVKMGMIDNVEELSESDFNLGHYRIYSRDLLREHVQEAGLIISYEQPFYLKPLPTSKLSGLDFEVHKALDLLGREIPEYASYIYLEAKNNQT